ncbi:MAG: hypothetical protein EOP49_31685, partial [Sphingobacteriales bacterium]
MRYLMQHCLTRILLLMILFFCAQTVAAQSTQPCAPPNGNILADPASGEACAGGSVQLTAPAGFTYQWFRDAVAIAGATNRIYEAVGSGQYSVQLFKQNCDAFADNVLNVTIHPAVTASAAVVQPTCAVPTGTITVTAGGGSGAGYEYSINGGTDWVSAGVFTNVAAGNYSVLVRDGNLCKSEPQPVTINAAISPVNINVTTVDAGCLLATGSITAIASGGASPYTYELTGRGEQGVGVFLGLAAGNYTLTVTDANSCVTSQIVTVDQFLNTITATAAKTDIDCENPTGSVTVNASGALLLTYRLDEGDYQSSPTFSNLPVGPHTVTVREGVRQCVRTVDFEILDLTKTVTASIASQTDVSCAGGNTGSVTVTPGG